MFSNLGLRRFTQVKKKVLLLKDHPTLGFKGEHVFVKPSFAMSKLIPKRLGVMATDPNYKRYLNVVDKNELQKKQEMRLYHIFVDRLKSIKVKFVRPVSHIN